MIVTIVHDKTTDTEVMFKDCDEALRQHAYLVGLGHDVHTYQGERFDHECEPIYCHICESRGRHKMKLSEVPRRMLYDALIAMWNAYYVGQHFTPTSALGKCHAVLKLAEHFPTTDPRDGFEN